MKIAKPHFAPLGQRMRNEEILSPKGECVASQSSFFISLFFILFLLASCGVDSDRFRLEGRLRNINQGEFLIYNSDGSDEGIDTIFVREGRFQYETPLRTPTIFIVIFPNYSEQPIFAEPGEVVTIKGDASHMKEMTIEGTDDNEDMTKLRQELNRLMPPEIPKAVERFIKEKPGSPVSNYLLMHYYIMDPEADYDKGYQLVKEMVKAQPDNGQLQKWMEGLDGMRNNKKDSRLPAFSAIDVNGRRVTQDQLKSKVNVVTLWATWNFNSTDIQRRLQKSKKKYGDKLSILSICLDGRPNECRDRVRRDSIKWPNICDGKMWQTPLVAKFGMNDVSANLIVNDKGVIIDRNLQPLEIEEKIDKLLK